MRLFPRRAITITENGGMKIHAKKTHTLLAVVAVVMVATLSSTEIKNKTDTCGC
jgi:hypothetical protein